VFRPHRRPIARLCPTNGGRLCRRHLHCRINPQPRVVGRPQRRVAHRRRPAGRSGGSARRDNATPISDRKAGSGPCRQLGSTLAGNGVVQSCAHHLFAVFSRCRPGRPASHPMRTLHVTQVRRHPTLSLIELAESPPGPGDDRRRCPPLRESAARTATPRWWRAVVQRASCPASPRPPRAVHCPPASARRRLPPPLPAAPDPHHHTGRGTAPQPSAAAIHSPFSQTAARPCYPTIKYPANLSRTMPCNNLASHELHHKPSNHRPP